MKRIPSDFVAKMAHDLKTPVGNAMMYTELLSEDIQTLCDEHPEMAEQLEALDQFSRNIHLSSSKLINSIQSWSYVYQMEDRVFELNPQKLNLEDLLTRIISYNDLFIRGKSLNVEVAYESGHKEYECDEEVLRLIFDNLLTYIITMARNNDTIRITASDDDDRILFRFFAGEPAFRQVTMEAYAGDFSLEEQMVPEQGILKPGGYGLIFANLALQYIGASRGVDDQSVTPRSFWFRLPLP